MPGDKSSYQYRSLGGTRSAIVGKAPVSDQILRLGLGEGPVIVALVVAMGIKDAHKAAKIRLLPAQREIFSTCRSFALAAPEIRTGKTAPEKQG